jgi:hypothetical protein
MVFVDDIWQKYIEMYDTIPDEQWNSMAESYDITVDQLKGIFRVKPDEYEWLSDFVEDYLNEYPIIQEFFDRMGDESIIEDVPIDEIFFGAMGKLINDEGIELLLEDQAEQSWTCVIADIILMSVYDQLYQLISS